MISASFRAHFRCMHFSEKDGVLAAGRTLPIGCSLDRRQRWPRRIESRDIDGRSLSSGSAAPAATAANDCQPAASVARRLPSAATNCKMAAVGGSAVVGSRGSGQLRSQLLPVPPAILPAAAHNQPSPSDPTSPCAPLYMFYICICVYKHRMMHMYVCSMSRDADDSLMIFKNICIL